MSHIKTVMAVIILASACMVFCATGSDDSSADTAEYTSAEGKTSTGTGGATWKYGEGVLTISGTGTVKAGFNSSSASGWGTWELTKVEVAPTTDPSTGGSSTPAAQDSSTVDLTKIYPDDIFASSFNVVIDSNVTIESEAFKNIKAKELDFGSKATTLGAGAFKNCQTLEKVTFSNLTSIGAEAFSNTKLAEINLSKVTSVGAKAFSGCTSLTTADIGKATIADDTFEGCTKFKTIKATDSTAYKVNDNVLYSADGKKLVCCPATKYSVVTPVTLPSTVTDVNMGLEKAVYIIDMNKAVGSTVVVKKIGTTVNAAAVKYSSQGMEEHTASWSGNTFTIKDVKLYDGWRIDSGCMRSSGTPTVSGGSISVPVAAGSEAYLYPMGVEKITKKYITDELAKGLNGWTISSSLDVDSDVKDGDILTDVNALTIQITGYNGGGSAKLNNNLVFYGIAGTITGFTVGGDYSKLRNLEIVGDMKLPSALFENSNLVSVKMDDVTSVDAKLFRYSTKLDSVSLKACASIGDSAFEGCLRLQAVGLGADKISFGRNVFSSCSNLDMLVVGTSTEVTGNPGLFLVHVDGQVDVSLSGDCLVVKGSYSGLDYSATKDGPGKAVSFYKGGVTSVYVGGMTEVFMTVRSGAPSGDCLITYDTGLDMRIDNLVVKSGDKLANLTIPSKDGYRFLGWSCGLEQVTKDTTVTTSMVLEAKWQKEDSTTHTGYYVLALFAVAIVASVAVVMLNARR